MGLITGLLTLPLAPVRGVAWLTEQIADQAERELYDESRIVAELGQIEAAHNRGEVSDEQFDAYVDELLARLEIGRQLELEREATLG
jgi:Gas vesicle protein G